MQVGVYSNCTALRNVLHQPTLDAGAGGGAISHQLPAARQLLLCLHATAADQHASVGLRAYGGYLWQPNGANRSVSLKEEMIKPEWVLMQRERHDQHVQARPHAQFMP